MKKIHSIIHSNKEIGMAQIDSFTGIYNRDFFMISLERELLRSRRNGRSVTLAMIGVDSSDIYHKNHGFLPGTRIIKDLTTIIVSTIRKEVDLAAHLGEDVIALLLPNTDTKSAMVVIERIRSRFAAKNQNALNVSIGLSTYPSDGDKSDTLIQKAQEALSEAKHQWIHFFENQVFGSSKPVPQI